jgi:hypothetical protein
MKKLTLIVLTILGIAFASYGSNSMATQQNTFGNGSVVEKAKPHTKQYQDVKKFVDKYENAVNKASSCDELDDAQIEFYVNLLTLIEIDYDDDDLLTEEEDQELSDRVDRINNKVELLQTKWACPTEEDDIEEEDLELIETSTEEWEEIINEFDAIVTQMEKMRGLDFDDDKNLDKLMEVVLPLEQLSERMDHSSVDNITARQTSRLEDINNRLVNVATALGLMDE